MKEFIIILLLSAILCITLGRDIFPTKCTSDGVGKVNIEQAIQSGGLVYDR